MQTCLRTVIAALICLSAASAVSAQEPRFSIAGRGGATIEDSEDGLTGTAAAIGATGSFAFNCWWRGEIEFWLPQYLEDDAGEPKHRDVLFGFSAVRTFGEGRARPFVLAGVSFSRTQDWFTFCTAERAGPGGTPVRALVGCDEPDVIERRRERNDGTDGYALVGGGVEIALTPRVNVVADLRVNLAPASVLVRPAAGIAFRF